MSPDSRQHLGAFTGLTRTSPDGLLIFDCVYCHQPIADGEGGLTARSGEPWRSWCWNHEPPPSADGERVWQVPVEQLRTAEMVLVKLAGWIETPWMSPNWSALMAALARVVRNAYLERRERRSDSASSSHEAVINKFHAAFAEIQTAFEEYVATEIGDDDEEAER